MLAAGVRRRSSPVARRSRVLGSARLWQLRRCLSSSDLQRLAHSGPGGADGGFSLRELTGLGGGAILFPMSSFSAGTRERQSPPHGWVPLGPGILTNRRRIMLTKNRIGLFGLLLATGWIAPGEATARVETEALPDPEAEALPSPEQPEAEGADNGAAAGVCAAGRPNCVIQPYWICVHDGDKTYGACDPDVPGTKCTIPEVEIPGRPDTGNPGRKA